MSMKFVSFFRSARLYALHFFFPKICFGCGCDLPVRQNGHLCPACANRLKKPGPHICQRCGAVLKSGGAHCYACRGSKAKKYKCQIIRAAFVFNTSSRGLVHALKYAGADYAAQEMGEKMLSCFSQHVELAQADLIMPVPLHPKKQRTRGYNQSELLARVFAAQLGLPLDTVSLVRVRDTVSQTTLGRQGRLQNMLGAFACLCPARVKGKTVLLIDDVATTGATLEGCAVALKQAGAKRVLAYVFARE